MLGVSLGPFLWDLRYRGSYSPNLQKLRPTRTASARALSTASASRFLLFPLKSFLCAKLLFCFHFPSVFSCSYNLHHGLLHSLLPVPVLLTHQSSLDSLVPSSQQNPIQGTKHHCQPFISQFQPLSSSGTIFRSYELALCLWVITLLPLPAYHNVFFARYPFYHLSKTQVLFFSCVLSSWLTPYQLPECCWYSLSLANPEISCSWLNYSPS